jgi:hypothetical protein
LILELDMLAASCAICCCIIFHLKPASQYADTAMGKQTAAMSRTMLSVIHLQALMPSIQRPASKKLSRHRDRSAKERRDSIHVAHASAGPS